MDSWYFAYGSNLWTEQMIARTGAIGHADHPPRIACLSDHRLVFQRLENSRQAYANILSPGDGVLGVVYHCGSADLDRLDDYEGGYERRPVQVTDGLGKVLDAVAYVMRPSQAADTGRPGTEYLDKIVTGARQHGLPEQYIDTIVNIALSDTP